MAARLTALVLLLAVGATAVVPMLDGARCLIMNQRMSAADEDCCASCHAPAVTSIGTPCCEIIHGRALDARASQTVEHPRLLPAPLLALLSFPSPLAADLGRTCRYRGSHVYGRPTGQQLQQLSQVLRV